MNKTKINVYKDKKLSRLVSSIDLNKTGIQIGRSQKSDLYVADTKISRKHVRIDSTSKGIVITDLNSANGVYLNGKKIKTSTYIYENDTIQVGRHFLRISSEGSDDKLKISIFFPGNNHEEKIPAIPFYLGYNKQTKKVEPTVDPINDNNFAVINIDKEGFFCRNIEGNQNVQINNQLFKQKRLNDGDLLSIYGQDCYFKVQSTTASQLVEPVPDYYFKNESNKRFLIVPAISIVATLLLLYGLYYFDIFNNLASTNSSSAEFTFLNKNGSELKSNLDLLYGFDQDVDSLTLVLDASMVLINEYHEDILFAMQNKPSLRNDNIDVQIIENYKKKWENALYLMDDFKNAAIRFQGINNNLYDSVDRTQNSGTDEAMMLLKQTCLKANPSFQNYDSWFMQLEDGISALKPAMEDSIFKEDVISSISPTLQKQFSAFSNSMNLQKAALTKVNGIIEELAYSQTQTD